MLYVMARKKKHKFIDMVEGSCGLIITFIAHGNMS